MTVVPSRQANWLIGAFICTVLILLVVIPLVVSHKTGAILADLNEHADPADRLTSRLQAALSLELSGIVGFQVTGESRYLELYREQFGIVEGAVAELAAKTAPLGPTVESRYYDVLAAVENWQRGVIEHELTTIRLPPRRFQEVLLSEDHLFQHAQQSTARLNAAINTHRAAERGRIGNLARLLTTLSIVFAILVLIALWFVVKAVRRLDRSASLLETRARQEEALRQVAHSLTAAFTLPDVLGRITETASQAAGAEAVYVELIDEANDEITCVAEFGEGVPLTGTKGSFQGSLAAEVLEDGEPRIIPYISAEQERPSVFGQLAKTSGDCAAMVIPLIVERKKLGALFLIRRHPGFFSEPELPRVKILADMASLAIKRALDLDRIRKLQMDERFLSDAARILASSLDYNKTLKTVAQLAVPRIADWTAIHLIEDGVLRTVEVAHSDPAKLTSVRRLQENYSPRRGNELGAGRVVRTGEAELYPEVTDEMLRKLAENAEHQELLRAVNIRSAMVVPLSAGGETFGALTFASEAPRRYGRADLRFAEDIGRHMALAIQNARLYTSAERAIRARDEVLRVVSHDLRNPVSNIHMTARMLESGSLPEPKRDEMVAIINRAAERMNRLIEDLVSVARLREGQVIALNIQFENPIDVIQEACQVFTIQARGKSIELTCDASGPVPMVRADRHRMLQVISNLLDNALKFTPEGGRVSVSCEAAEGKVRFSVSDTGRGIAREHLDRVFDLFWQASPTAHMGAGFGLAIAKAIIEGHGGKIWAESAPGIGSTFFFTVPVAFSKEDVAEEHQAG